MTLKKKSRTILREKGTMAISMESKEFLSEMELKVHDTRMIEHLFLGIYKMRLK